jgi:Ca-activated chloride channel family protein
VKIQVEFNPLRVGAYRLVGYENRMLRAEDFRDDKKDAGEIGAGHTVTALYELVPPGKVGNLPKVDPLKYQKQVAPSDAARSEEIFTLKLAFKRPDQDKSEYLSFGITDPDKTPEQAGPDFQFAAAVACFGMLLRDSEHKGKSTFELCQELAQAGKGKDPSGYRSEFIQLVNLAKTIGKH